MKNLALNTKQEQQQAGKQDHTVRYVIYAAAAYFGLQYLFKPKRATAAIVTLEPATQVVATNDTTVTPVVQTSVNTVTPTKAVYPANPINPISESFPLRKGMRGQRIKAIQQKLGIAADGIFGNQTQAALLQQYRITTVSQAQYQTMMQSKPKAVKPTASSTAIVVLKKGSKGANVYRLQKWLGFKDRSVARKGEPIADSDFGTQTETALLKKTGQRFIGIDKLNAATKHIAGFGNTPNYYYTKQD